ncbi:MAG: hypothetical protein EOP80_14600 [Variovorax sp.]|nr:MAG: hypothetical protein EOP80_14600 [Variovorax sp.]
MTGKRVHEIVAAWLHVAIALLVAGCVAFLWFAAAELAPLMQGSFIPGLIAWVGRPVALTLFAVTALQLGAAVALLRQPGRGGTVLIVLSLLLLVIFPIGTAVGIYSLWALLVARAERTR